jgi:hypothetical protein
LKNPPFMEEMVKGGGGRLHLILSLSIWMPFPTYFMRFIFQGCVSLLITLLYLCNNCTDSREFMCVCVGGGGCPDPLYIRAYYYVPLIFFFWSTEKVWILKFMGPEWIFQHVQNSNLLLLKLSLQYKRYFNITSLTTPI